MTQTHEKIHEQIHEQIHYTSFRLIAVSTFWYFVCINPPAYPTNTRNRRENETASKDILI